MHNFEKVEGRRFNNLQDAAGARSDLQGTASNQDIGQANGQLPGNSATKYSL